MTHPADVFRVVFVCTGNRFRSVLAEHRFRRATVGLPVHVASLGTLEEAGAPALPDAVELAAEAGLDLGGHRSRRLRGEDLSEADLVVGFERSHVAAAVVDAHAARDRTFAAHELTELLARIELRGDLPPVERARDAVARADAARTGAPRPFRELPDPVGRGRAVAEETARQVGDQVARIAFGLFAAGPAGETAGPEGHLLFVWTARGWRLEQREGAPPVVGETVQTDGQDLTVTLVGPSPLPRDPRRCAYTQPS